MPSGTLFPDMKDITISEEGVLKILSRTNLHKAAGPDEIPARVLKGCTEDLAPPFTLMFDKTLTEVCVPKNCSALFKKSDKNCAANYRPVSVTSRICKVQEHIVTSIIWRHLDHHNTLTDCQHGFGARRSCETQLLTLTHEIASSLDRGTQIDMLIVVFCKAFDNVPHKRLFCEVITVESEDRLSSGSIPFSPTAPSKSSVMAQNPT
ncbi:uncharacterized protein LOC143299130 [Babylonia areolata]|uniref:uncharacterized protein LOC143299130 n=1 Tax=Babylonia areolata TaxID=304850 RepID=UPI003FD37083